MRIGEFADRTGVSASRIRFYEKVGLLPPAGRRDNGYRAYDARDEALVSIVERAQQLGFSLREIGGFLPHAGNGPLTCEAMLELLSAKLEQNDRLMDEVKRRRREITSMMADIRAGVYHPDVEISVPDGSLSH